MKFNYEIREIEKKQALDMVQKFHYSNSLPRLNKHFVGFYLENKLVGLVTLGWGTRPKHTIKKIFPSLDTKDYFEIGRMCMTEDMPKNSESQMLSQLIKWVKKNHPNIKVLFTWADGMLGKVGYVYQASSFLYAGNIITDNYIYNGLKIHPRQSKAIFKKLDILDNRNTENKRFTIEQLKNYKIKHIRGKQFRYLTFLCDRKQKAKLEKEALVNLSLKYPKEKDLMWEEQIDKGIWVKCDKPNYITDFNNESQITIDIFSGKMLTIFDFIKENN